MRRLLAPAAVAAAILLAAVGACSYVLARIPPACSCSGARR